MNNNGTSEAEQSLNVPKSEEELADAILTAVSEGNAEEMDRLFALEIQPDADQDEEEDSNEDSSDEPEEQSDKEPDGQPATSDDEEESRTTAQTAPTAEERIAKLEQELANAKALAGRTPALQSRLAQLENQLKKQQAANKQKEPEVSPEEQELADRIARLKEIDPDTAAILEALQKRAAKDVPKQTAQEEVTDNEHLQQEYYKLLEVHHDAGEILQHPYWYQWKRTLRPEQREWAESTDHQKVAVALSEFKKFMAAAPGVAQPTQVQAQPAQVEDVVDATKLAREKKLQRSADTSDKPVKKTATFDKDAFFAEAYEQAAKEAGIKY